jgi:hypothetical protein
MSNDVRKRIEDLDIRNLPDSQAGIFGAQRI